VEREGPQDRPRAHREALDALQCSLELDPKAAGTLVGLR
jgi:hypothetical protein